MKNAPALIFVFSILLCFPLCAQQDHSAQSFPKAKSLGDYPKAEISKSNPALSTLTAIAEANVSHNSQIIAVAIPRSARIVDIQYWCKEGEDALGNSYLMATISPHSAMRDPPHNSPYPYCYWDSATRWQEIDPATDAVQAVFWNLHSSVVRRGRLVVLYQVE
jgi:hypothetical protein